MKCRLQTSFADNVRHCRKSVVKTENIKNEPERFVFLGDVCVRQNLVFRAIFECVSDDK